MILRICLHFAVLVGLWLSFVLVFVCFVFFGLRIFCWFRDFGVLPFCELYVCVCIVAFCVLF